MIVFWRVPAGWIVTQSFLADVMVARLGNPMEKP